MPEGTLLFEHKLALSDVGFPTDNLRHKRDIFVYLNNEAPKYIRAYKKKIGSFAQDRRMIARV